MLHYQVSNYRPLGIPVRPQASVHRMGQTSGQWTAVGVSSLLAAALGAGTVWAGIRGAKNEKKKGYKALNYTVAVFGSIVVISSLGGAVAFFGGLLGAKPGA